MTLIQAKLLAAGAVLLIAVGYLGVTGVASGWVYFVDVDSFLSDSRIQGQRVRLHGKVGHDDFSVSSAGLSANFRLVGTHASLPVAYRGNIPELFAVDKDVVVEGRIDPSTGTFRADVLMTKCASKYEDGSMKHRDNEEAAVADETATPPEVRS